MSGVVEVEVAGVLFDETTEVGIVLLRRPGVRGRVFPMVIGPAEARSIAIGLTDVSTPRPLTHDLLLRAVEAASARVRRVDVVGKARDTFIGELEIESAVGVTKVDARPSDCIAVAIRCGAPIGVNGALFERASVVVVEEGGEGFEPEQIERIVSEFRTLLERADPDDFFDIPEPDDGADDDEGTGSEAS